MEMSEIFGFINNHNLYFSHCNVNFISGFTFKLILKDPGSRVKAIGESLAC